MSARNKTNRKGDHDECQNEKLDEEGDGSSNDSDSGSDGVSEDDESKTIKDVENELKIVGRRIFKQKRVK
jgi:hypothetical protein